MGIIRKSAIGVTVGALALIGAETVTERINNGHGLFDMGRDFFNGANNIHQNIEQEPSRNTASSARRSQVVSQNPVIRVGVFSTQERANEHRDDLNQLSDLRFSFKTQAHDNSQWRVVSTDEEADCLTYLVATGSDDCHDYRL